MIKAIETQYKGYRFRSRLEARWACFFDALGIEWEYEPEGYELPDGTRYLPDFWLPTFSGGMFVEVKPLGGDFAKARLFAEMGNFSIWLASGTPAPIFYEVGYAVSDQEVLWGDGAPNCADAQGENRMYAFSGCFKVGDDLPDDWDSGNVYLAAAAARSARFEYGENGIPRR